MDLRRSAPAAPPGRGPRFPPPSVPRHPPGDVPRLRPPLSHQPPGHRLWRAGGRGGDGANGLANRRSTLLAPTIWGQVAVDTTVRQGLNRLAQAVSADRAIALPPDAADDQLDRPLRAARARAPEPSRSDLDRECLSPSSAPPGHRPHLASPAPGDRCGPAHRHRRLRRGVPRGRSTPPTWRPACTPWVSWPTRSPVPVSRYPSPTTLRPPRRAGVSGRGTVRQTRH